MQAAMESSLEEANRSQTLNDNLCASARPLNQKIEKRSRLNLGADWFAKMEQTLFELNLSISSGVWGDLGGPELFCCLQVNTMKVGMKSPSRLLFINLREGEEERRWGERELTLTPSEGEQLFSLIKALGLEKAELAIEPVLDTSEGWLRFNLSFADLLQGGFCAYQVCTESSGIKGADALAFRQLIYAMFAQLGDDEGSALMRRFYL